MSATKKKKKKETPAELDEPELDAPIAAVEAEPEEVVEPEAIEPEVELEEEVAEVVPEVAPKPPGRKSIGVKEVTPFAWKIVGKSEGMLLTLFKAVEREEVAAQLERLEKEQYYTELAILPIAPPPPSALPPGGPRHDARPAPKEAVVVKPKPEPKEVKVEKEAKPPARKVAPRGGNKKPVKRPKPPEKSSARKKPARKK